VSNLFHPTVVIADAALDPEQWLFPKQFEATKPGAVVRPTYVVAEVAKFFFARSGAWLRAKEGKATLDGEPLVDFLGRARGERREYTLFDIERVAHALADSGFITGERLRLALRLLQLEAHLWRAVIEASI
jgi:hypothetical protein